MPHIDLASSALAPGRSPVRVYYRDTGSGPPIVILHGGWGYEVYPFDSQIAALASDHRVITPDRTGYGQSSRLEHQETDFHRRAADETFALIDALHLDRPVLWGHSDGAVIAILMALADPGGLRGIIVEAAHFFRSKPWSREFFETMMHNPDGLGGRVTAVLERDHGAGWRDVIRINGEAWLRIARDQSAPAADLYGGRISELAVPMLVVHGGRDPRTEPGELDAMTAALARARVAAEFVVLADGSHSPHSERATAAAVTQTVSGFVAALSKKHGRGRVGA